MHVAVLRQARARDLFYGLWTTDLFMQRVEADADWSLFCPSEAPGLADCWGEEHTALYTRYEREGRAKRVVKAHQLWFAILEAQVPCLCCPQSDSPSLEMISFVIRLSFKPWHVLIWRLQV